MVKINKDDMKELIAMQDMTVKEFLDELKKHPTLKILLTAAGGWLVARTILLLMIFGNLIYVAYRIVNMVLN